MPPHIDIVFREAALPPADLRTAWLQAEADLAFAGEDLAMTPPGIARQGPFRRLLGAEARSAALTRQWLAVAVRLRRVHNPRMLLVVGEGFVVGEGHRASHVGFAAALALSLLQRGRVGVLLNMTSGAAATRDMVRDLRVLGASAEYGAMVYLEGGLLLHEQTNSGSSQLSSLRSALRVLPDIVLDPSRKHSVRVSCIHDGVAGAMLGHDARELLERERLGDVGFRVTPHFTDFFMQGDGASGVRRIIDTLDLADLPLAAAGSSSVDVAVLRKANPAFVPTATLPDYQPVGGQRVVRCGQIADDALWETACELVPSAELRREVLDTIDTIMFPEWFPPKQRNRPVLGAGALRLRGRRWPVHVSTATTTTATTRVRS